MEELLSDVVVQSSEFILDSYAPSRTKCRVILLLIYIYIAGFDSISDLVAWGSFLKIGFAHPLLPTPLLWSVVWGLFALTGLGLAMMSTSHEIMKLFHLKGSFCQTHVELMPVAGLLLEDVPMLVLVSLYGLSQYTCSTGSIIASSDTLVPILISSIGTALATFWRLMLTLLRFREMRGKKKSGGRHLAGITNNQDNSSNCDNKRVSPSFEFEMLARNVTRSGCGGSNVKETHTQRHPNPQCSGRHNRFNSMKLWVQNCYKGFIFLFGLAICLLSILVVVGVSYLMVEQNPLFVHRPHDPLMIFAPSAPCPHPLANISDVIDNNNRVTLIYENRCLLVFQYKAEQHVIVYNFGDVNTTNQESSETSSGIERRRKYGGERGTRGQSTDTEGCKGEGRRRVNGGEEGGSKIGMWCEEKLSDLFYGSYRDGGGVEVFHEQCIAVHVVLLPRVTAKPVRDTSLEVVVTN